MSDTVDTVDFMVSHLDEQTQVANIVKKCMLDNEISLNGGGCQAFYTPQEWRDRNEEFGLDSVLIICHDGGNQAMFFNIYYGCHDLCKSMSDALDKEGYYILSCTSWYSAIYKT